MLRGGGNNLANALDFAVVSQMAGTATSDLPFRVLGDSFLFCRAGSSLIRVVHWFARFAGFTRTDRAVA
jgi:hypothetical protein